VSLGDARTRRPSAAIVGIEVENQESLPHHLQPRPNLLLGVAAHQRGPLREQSSLAEAVTCREKSPAATERAPVKVNRSRRLSNVLKLQCFVGVSARGSLIS